MKKLVKYLTLALLTLSGLVILIATLALMVICGTLFCIYVYAQAIHSWVVKVFDKSCSLLIQIGTLINHKFKTT